MPAAALLCCAASSWLSTSRDATSFTSTPSRNSALQAQPNALAQRQGGFLELAAFHLALWAALLLELLSLLLLLLQNMHSIACSAQVCCRINIESSAMSCILQQTRV
jgi:hypothetical protein